MVAPLAVLGVMAGAQVASGLMQYYQSEKARKASNKRLKEIEAMFDAIVPPDFNISVWDDPSLVAQIPPPAFDLESIDKTAYQSVGQFVPEIAEFVREAKPQLVEATANATEGRQAQMDALRRYREIAASGNDPELQAAMSQASRASRIDAQSARDSSLQDAQRRGLLGSGLEMATQQNAMAQAMERQALESQAAAVASYRNRLNAVDQSAALGGRVRESEMSEQARNAGIINDFNARTSTRRQQYENARADTVNNANLRNLNAEQELSNRNVDRRDRLQQQDFQNKTAQQDRRWEVEDRKNKLKQQMYANLMGKAQGKAGIASTGIDYLLQDSRDRQQQYQNVADTVSAGALYYGANAPKDQPAAPDDQFQNTERGPAESYGYGQPLQRRRYY